MAKAKGLGRGLDALFLDNDQPESKSDGVSMLRLSEIEPEKNQPRQTFEREALEELASSISLHGLIQPIVVRKGENGMYRIVAGERRWRASKMAGLSEVPVRIMDIDDRKASELALIENLQREDLNAIEEASAYQSLIEEYDLTQDEVSSRIGKSRSAVANSLRLLDLPEKTVELVKKGNLSAGHARALLGLNDKSLIDEVAKKTVDKGFSVRMTEQLVRSLNKQKTEEKEEKSEYKVDYVADLEKRVRAKLGRRFNIKSKGKVKRIEIEYSDESDLEEIIKKLCGRTFFED